MWWCTWLTYCYWLWHNWIPVYELWQYRLWSFQQRNTKLELFWLKINIPKGNHWILRICVALGRCQKVPKFDFQSQFSMSKVIGIFLIFLIEEGAHFLVTSIFKSLALFWQLPWKLHNRYCHNISRYVRTISLIANYLPTVRRISSSKGHKQLSLRWEQRWWA